MAKFIKKALNDINSKDIGFNDCVFILPNKRAGVVLLYVISNQIDSISFAPQILSIEEFVTELSDLKPIKSIELLFELYEVYKKFINGQDEIEDFDSFSKWGQLLIQDFNEIDRYLVEPNQIFDYLSAIQEINHWSLETNKTEFIKNHLKFWKQLKSLYHNFSEKLLSDKKAYQGLVYREAISNLEAFSEQNLNHKYIFLGFNALNKSESLIIQDLLNKEKALIYWDIDNYFLNRSNHNVNQFISRYKKVWSFYENNPFLLPTKSYLDSKNINVISVPKMVGQAKTIGNIIQKFSNEQLANTGIVLGEEQLLEPLLSSLPKSIDKVNITMGLPLKNTPMASLFQQWFNIHAKGNNNYYFKDVIKLISHTYLKEFMSVNGLDGSLEIKQYIQKNNLTYTSLNQLLEINPHLNNKIKFLFEPWHQNVSFALSQISNLISEMKINIEKIDNEVLFSEYLYRFNVMFSELKNLNETYKSIDNINTLSQVYNLLLSSETLDFSGEPLSGLQIMGVLETRALDFDTVIISSVNEGILPAGKTDQSFIPFDVKIENNLPTFKDKDTIYSYHFFRLLQRAKNIYLIYNTEVDALKGGEKSRFITQLEIEKIHQINYFNVLPELDKSTISIKKINKTNDIYEKLKSIALKGFSPSSLINYIRNPLDFYYKSILGIKDFDEVEEHLASNSFGTVVHNTLEILYKPLIGKKLNVKLLKELLLLIEDVITAEFSAFYKISQHKKGKNKIIFEVAKQYVINFIELEINDINKGNEIEIIALEEDILCEIPIENLDFPVKLKGKIDRIDCYNGQLRIIDYKTGKVKQSEVEIINWEEISTDFDKYSKSFQLLAYVYMLKANNKIQFPVEAGIFSFKNLNEGFLKFCKKDRMGRSAKKDTLITQDFINIFEKELQKLILEICNQELDFIEKEIKQVVF